MAALLAAGAAAVVTQVSPPASAATAPAGATMTAPASVAQGGTVTVTGTGCTTAGSSTSALVQVLAPGGTVVASAVVPAGLGATPGTWLARLQVPSTVALSPFYQVAGTCSWSGSSFTYLPTALGVVAGAGTLTLSTDAAAPSGTFTVSGSNCAPGAQPTSVALVLVDPYGNDVAASAATPGSSGTWSATIAVPSLATPGAYEVTATCDTYTSAFVYSPQSVVVDAGATAQATTLTWMAPTSTPGGKVTSVTAQLVSAGSPVAGKQVNFNVAGVVASARTGVNGIAQALVTMPSTATAAAKASFPGDAGFGSSVASTSIALTAAVAPTSMAVSATGLNEYEPASLMGTLTSNGTPIVGRGISFVVTTPSGVTNTAVATNSQGVATLPYQFNFQGQATVQVIFASASGANYGPSESQTLTVNVGPPFVPTAVACGTSSTCVVVGSAGVARSTNTNGTSWAVAAAPPTAAMASVACHTGVSCVAVGAGGAIFTTANGGVNWTPVTSPTSAALTEVRCAVNTCVAVGANGAVLTSTTSGSSWTTDPSPEPAMTFNGLSCPSVKFCLATATNPTTGASATLTTTTAGASWTVTASSEPQFPTSESTIACVSATLCVASGGGVWVSTNGGASWARQSASSGYLPSGAVACGTTTSCVTWNGYATGASTSSALTSWAAGPPAGTGTQPFDLSCTSTLCVGINGPTSSGSAVAAVSTNGGQQWAAPTGI